MLKFLIIFILVVMAVRLLLRLVLPTIVKTVFRSLQEQQARQQAGPSRPEGSVFVSGKAPKNKPTSADDGEYVDYEEIR